MAVYSSLLSETEKWFFDLNGYLVLRGVIEPDRLAAMLEVINHWLTVDARELPAPVVRHRQEPFKTHLDHIQYGHPLFQALNTDPTILRIVAGLTLDTPRLFHCNFTAMRKPDPGEPEPTFFHRDDSGFKFPPGFRNPHNDYQVSGGEIYCSHLATWVALVDIPERTGLCVIPGSHKSLFREPRGMAACHNPPLSMTIPLKAGDAIVFSTNLIHEAAMWTEAHPRMNIFQRYQLSVYFNESGKGGYPLEEYRSQISEAEYELESLGRQEKTAVKQMKIRDEFGQADCGLLLSSV